MADAVPDLLIVGAGIAGSCLARMAWDRGLHAIVVAATTWMPPASALSLGVMRIRWMQGYQEAAARFALEYYTSLAALTEHSAMVSTYLRPGRLTRQDDWYAVDQERVLVQPTVCAMVAGVRGDGVMLSYEAGRRRIPARRVVICGGKGTGELLPWLEPGATERKRPWGATATAPSTGARGLRVHLLRPFHHCMVLDDGRSMRIGASVANTPVEARSNLYAMIGVAQDMAMIPPRTDWRVRVGYRVPPMTRPVGITPEGVGYITGLYRTGYATAPAYARQLLDLLETQ